MEAGSDMHRGLRHAQGALGGGGQRSVWAHGVQSRVCHLQAVRCDARAADESSWGPASPLVTGIPPFYNGDTPAALRSALRIREHVARRGARGSIP